jgi:hypothetical protein
VLKLAVLPIAPPGVYTCPFIDETFKLLIPDDKHAKLLTVNVLKLAVLPIAPPGVYSCPFIDEIVKLFIPADKHAKLLTLLDCDTILLTVNVLKLAMVGKVLIYTCPFIDETFILLIPADKEAKLLTVNVLKLAVVPRGPVYTCPFIVETVKLFITEFPYKILFVTFARSLRRTVSAAIEVFDRTTFTVLSFVVYTHSLSIFFALVFFAPSSYTSSSFAE